MNNDLEKLKRERLKQSRLQLIQQLKALPDEEQNIFLSSLSGEEFDSLMKIIKRNVA